MHYPLDLSHLDSHQLIRYTAFSSCRTFVATDSAVEYFKSSISAICLTVVRVSRRGRLRVRLHNRGRQRQVLR